MFKMAKRVSKTDNRAARDANSPRGTAEPDLTTPMDKVTAYLENLRFRRRTFGGVDEQDVWKKLAELNALYEKALDAEHARCNAYIEQYHDSCNRALARQRAQYDPDFAREFYAQEEGD